MSDEITLSKTALNKTTYKGESQYNNFVVMSTEVNLFLHHIFVSMEELRKCFTVMYGT